MWLTAHHLQLHILYTSSKFTETIFLTRSSSNCCYPHNIVTYRDHWIISTMWNVGSHFFFLRCKWIFNDCICPSVCERQSVYMLLVVGFAAFLHSLVSTESIINESTLMEMICLVITRAVLVPHVSTSSTGDVKSMDKYVLMRRGINWIHCCAQAAALPLCQFSCKSTAWAHF